MTYAGGTMTVPTNGRLRTNLALAFQAFAFRDPCRAAFQLHTRSDQSGVGGRLVCKV